MPDKRIDTAGTLAAIGAFLIWGLLPIYWKALLHVPALELLSHRIIWSLVFIGVIILVKTRRPRAVEEPGSSTAFLILVISSLFIAVNWLVYIWAVNNNHILETSLGYYINPLLNILLGRIFLGERLRAPQKVAVLVAVAGVAILAFNYGKIPWIALTLSTSFGMYGLLKKKVKIGSLAGLGVETAYLSVFALEYLIYLAANNSGAMCQQGLKTDLLLVGAGPVTAIPLLLFAFGVKRITLSTTGFIQYLAPTGMFALGVFIYKEPFTAQQLVTFCLIWLSLVIYTVDQYRVNKPNNLTHL